MSNLLLRKNHYTAVVMIPKELQQTFGKTRFSKSLGTGDKRLAQALAAPWLSLWKAQIDKARGTTSIMEQAMVQWQEFFNIQTQAIEQATNASYKAMAQNGMDELIDTFNDHLRTLPEHDANILHNLVNGKSVLTSEHYQAWYIQLTLSPKVKGQAFRDVQILIDRFSTLEEITKERILDLISELELQGKGVSTFKRLLKSFRSYWLYLQDKRIVSLEHNPFDVQKILQGKFNRLEKKKPKMQEFTPEEVVKMWSIALAKKNPDYQLADLIVLGAYTGARIGELCALELKDVTDDRFIIRDAKTTAGIREIPIHSILQPLISRLRSQSKDGYLISSLSKDQYGDRSNAMSLRFSELKTKAGCVSTLVFHSLRRTLITLLEQAEVPENFSCDIVGHAKGTMGYGHYSGGASMVNKKESIEKVSYPFNIIIS